MLIINEAEVNAWVSALKEQFPGKAKVLDATIKNLKENTFRNTSEMRKVFNSMERYPELKNGYRFDIGGRKGLRMIAIVVIHADQIEVVYLGDHDGYDKFKP